MYFVYLLVIICIIFMYTITFGIYNFSITFFFINYYLLYYYCLIYTTMGKISIFIEKCAMHLIFFMLS